VNGEKIESQIERLKDWKAAAEERAAHYLMLANEYDERITRLRTKLTALTNGKEG
jgi:hypothetical protein